MPALDRGVTAAHVAGNLFNGGADHRQFADLVGINLLFAARHFEGDSLLARNSTSIA